jgi:hypothetical protein
VSNLGKDIGKIDWVKAVLNEVNGVVLFLKSHQKSRALWEKHGGKTLKLPPDTRFVYNFIMVLAIKADKAAARKTVVDDQWDPWLDGKDYKQKGKAICSRVLSDSFWAGVDLISKIAEPLVCMCKTFDSETPIMGLIYVTVLEFEEEMERIEGLSPARVKQLQKVPAPLSLFSSLISVYRNRNHHS